MTSTMNSWSRRMRKSSLLLTLSIGCGSEASEDPTGSSEGTDETGGSSEAGRSTGDSSNQISECELPTYQDDIVLGPAQNLDATADRVIAFGDRAVTCGDGFVALRGATQQLETTTDPSLVGTCAGLAVVGDNRVFSAHRSGQLTLFEVDDRGILVVVAATTATTTVYDIAARGDDVWVAAGSEGVLRYSVAGTEFEALGELPGSSDARGLGLVGEALLVADGHTPGPSGVGAAHVRLLDAAGSGVIAEIEHEAAIATRVVVEAGQAIVILPGLGFDVLDVSEDSMSLRYSTYTGHGLPVDVAVHDDTLILASLSYLLRYELSNAEASLVSSQSRTRGSDLSPATISSVAYVDEEWIAVVGDQQHVVELGEGLPAPQIAVDNTTFSVFDSEGETLFPFQNIGTANLIYTAASAESPFSAEPYSELATEVEGCPGQYIVEPGSTGLSWIRYDGDDAEHLGAVVVSSDDPDDGKFEGELEVNRPVMTIGDPVEDFRMPTVDGGWFHLSEHRGKVVLAKLYNPL